MREIFPTLFALDKETFEKKLNLLSKISKNIHIDFMDGKFTEQASVNFDVISEIKNFKENNFQIHLMSYNPHKYLPKIKELGINKVLIHPEVFLTDDEILTIINLFKREKIEVLLVLNPTTPNMILKPFVNEISGVMLMSVFPGKENQVLLRSVLAKIRELKESYPSLKIQIDGGINDKNASEVFEAGADNLCVGSYISSSKTPEKNLETLRKIAKKFK